MIIINSLNINELSDKIEVNISTEVGRVFTTVSVWNSSTYKDPSQGIDVSSLLLATSENEVFDIPASMLGVNNILGVWFLEFTNDEVIDPDACCQDNVRIGIVSNFTPYHLCILDGLMNMKIDGCLGKAIDGCEECSSNTLYKQTLLDSLYYALNHGFYDEAIKLTKVLDDECEVCNTCPDYGDTVLLNGGGYGVFDNILKLL